MSTLATSVISNVYDTVLSLVYPQRCAVCSASVESRHDGVACATCWTATRIFAENDALCWKCGSPSSATIAETTRPAVGCGKCEPDAFTAARASGLYEGALRASVLALKREPHVARHLVQELVRVQERNPLSEADLIVPVPLHPAREQERGFNQAALLARELANARQLPFDDHILVRRIHTERHRAGMDARARRESVAGAFEVRAPKLIAGLQILLIDDVFTTGATVSECAAVLKSAGATQVYVLTPARA